MAGAKLNIEVLTPLTGSMDRDMERSEKLILAIKQNGYITKDNATAYIHYKDEDRRIKKVDYKFEYPDEVIDLLTSLNMKCSAYNSNRENCTGDCKNLN